MAAYDRFGRDDDELYPPEYPAEYPASSGYDSRASYGTAAPYERAGSYGARSSYDSYDSYQRAGSYGARHSYDSYERAGDSYDPYERAGQRAGDSYDPYERAASYDPRSSYDPTDAYDPTTLYGRAGYRHQRGGRASLVGYPPAEPRSYPSRARRSFLGWDPAPRGEPAPAQGGRRDTDHGTPLWQEVPLLLIIAFCLAVLIRTFLMQAFFIPSGSMENTLLVGDRVLVNKIIYDFREPARGEVVVFRGTAGWAPENPIDRNVGFVARVGNTLGDIVGISQPGEKDFIKRVIGLPGDRVSCCDVDGRVLVNGQPLDEVYVEEDAPLDAPGDGCGGRRFDEVVVEPGQMFVMGDHRLVSLDSRCQGQVPIDDVIGRAFVIVWPTGRWGGMSVPETFHGVPAPSTLVATEMSAAESATAVSAADVATVPPAAGQLLILLPVPVTAFRRKKPYHGCCRAFRTRPARLTS